MNVLDVTRTVAYLYTKTHPIVRMGRPQLLCPLSPFGIMADSPPIVKIPLQVRRPTLAYGISDMIGRDVGNDQVVLKCPMR